jgi:hypothetical protein
MELKLLLVLTLYKFIISLTLGLLSIIVRKASVNGFYFSNNSAISESSYSPPPDIM